MDPGGSATRCVDKIRQLIYIRCHNVETLAGGYYNRHQLLWPHSWSTCTPTTFVFVPYAYPTYERQQRKPAHTSNSFAFILFINERSFIKRCAYGTERLTWSNAVRCVQWYRESVPKRTSNNTNPNTDPNPKPNPDPKSNPKPNPNPMSQTFYLTEIQLRPITTLSFLINNWWHIDAELWTLLQHKRAQRRSIYLGHMSAG